MRRTSRAVVIMIAIVALAASAAAVPRVAAASPGAADPGLTLSADRTALRSGDVLQLTGRLSVPDATLVLSRRTATETDFAVLSTLTADGSGSATYALHPQVGATYRLDFAGDATWAPARSEVTVAVAPRVFLSAVYRRPLFSGDLVTLRLGVSPAHPGAEAELQLLDGGSWVTFKHVTLDARSRAFVRWRVDRTMGLRIRAQLPGDADHVAASSRRRSLFANPANAHRVPSRFAHYIVIVVHEYTLYYYEHGKVVRRFNVALGRPGYPTPIGTFRIYGKRRPGGGALGACVMYYYPPGAIAIHGTDQPYLLNDPLPRNYSHGCCRMYNSQALWLYHRCSRGTIVRNLR